MFVLLATLALASAVKPELNEQSWKYMTTHGNELVGTGRMKRFIRLNKDVSENKKLIKCDLPDGTHGFCRPTPRCLQENTKINSQMYTNFICALSDSKFGFCCPFKTGAEGLAGELPAIASKDEDTELLMRMTRAENRGCGVSTLPRYQTTSGSARVWPWMVSITKKGANAKHFCGGALITDRHILTAAHCFNDLSPKALEVRLGEYDFRRTNESRTYIFKVVKIITHELYDKIPLQNDIAILKLHRPAVFDTYVWPICLPPVGLDLVNKTVILTGWGTTDFGAPLSKVLLEVDMPIWEHQKCIDSFVDTVFDENYCAGAYSGGKDACQHDSGSPLMYQMPSGRWVAVGIVIWGLGCAEINHPGLYTRNDMYLEWINQNTLF